MLRTNQLFFLANLREVEEIINLITPHITEFNTNKYDFIIRYFDMIGINFQSSEISNFSWILI